MSGVPVDDEEYEGGGFIWHRKKERSNIKNHGVSFREAVMAFHDPHRLIEANEKHSETEDRFFCYGKTPRGILTVRFTWRSNKVRIIGAGYWRKGRKLYEAING